ncbi:unnamed protein product [Caenorhabditis auriculariae]|uniref:TMC domain-containing protein n=1 Tax=Caenorhabditis auriculariae TaxID=2777116 RepID=A0A8S1GPX3_9PELO|nr:unnamed protein product [Caenorhabditis auriculariae]
MRRMNSHHNETRRQKAGNGCLRGLRGCNNVRIVISAPAITHSFADVSHSRGFAADSNSCLHVMTICQEPTGDGKPQVEKRPCIGAARKMPRFGGQSQPLVRHDTDDAGESGHSTKSLTDGGVTSEDEIESRMSRRSSVLADLISLFRRSSSVLIRPHTRLGFPNGPDEDDEDYDEEESRNMSKDRILEAIQHKKEIIQKLRGQPWNMKRKRRTLRVAQRHLQRQEAKVSKVRLYKAEAGRRLTQISRWFDNFKIYLIPWESKIKQIESHFGSVVSSYFTFHRWVLGVNIIMTLIMLLFVIIPEWLADSRMTEGSMRFNKTKTMKIMPEAVRQRADELSTVWDFGGYFQYSLLFYGFYSRETFFGETIKYRVPVAYFLCNIFVLGFSLFIILRKMASNARTSKLSSGKTEQYLFNWKAFTGWDYSIGNAETAGNVHMANVIKFREAIAEYSVNMKKKFQWVQIFLRIFCNMLVCIMLLFSIWAILACSQIKNPDSFIQQNAVAITISLITLIFPNLFDILGKLERYHPRTALRIQLARVLFLYIVNYYTLIVSLMLKLSELENERKALEESYALIASSHEYVTRSLRQVMPVYPANNTPYTYYSYQPVTTTPIPRKPWTTVLPDFGPFGVSNPKAVVSKGATSFVAPIVVTQVIGPNSDWNESAVSMLFPEFINAQSTLTTEKLRVMQYTDMCWETIIGQEITKLISMDLYMTVAAIIVIDFLRGLACRYFNFFWPWDLERTFPEYGEFKVAENVLHLVNNQGMIWLGLFFVPMLPMLNNIKLIILMYIRAWAAMTCNVPARQIFRASRSSNFYLMLLLLFLFLCTLPVGYVIASRTPSKSCGPFGNQPFFYSVITDVLHENLNAGLVDAIKYMMSPGIIIPLLVLLLLVIYFLFALVRGLREANHDLSTQLMIERTEEKKKIFELAGGKKRKSISVFGRKKSRAVITTIPKPKPVSDDESLSYQKSTARSNSGRAFVPSLGSVSEVDHSLSEEDEEEVSVVSSEKKLTLGQKFLICIGLKAREKKKRSKEIEMEEGENTSSEEEAEEDEDDDNEPRSGNSESRFLLPPEHTRNMSRERSESRRSTTSRKTSGRDASYRTAIQSYEGPPEKNSSNTSSSSKSTTAPTNTDSPRPDIIVTENPLDTYITPYNIQTKNSSGISSSSSPSSGKDVKEPSDSSSREKQAAKRLLQPISTQHNVRYGVATVETSQDPTRPPSADGSLSDPSPLPDSQWYNSNPHSSYTSAMMSPIMNEMFSTDETTDDERGRLIPDRPPIPTSPRDRRKTKEEKEKEKSLDSKPGTPRAPRFRISMSPPRKAPSDKNNDSDSLTRKYEMRVEQSARKKRADKQEEPEDLHKTTTL